MRSGPEVFPRAGDTVQLRRLQDGRPWPDKMPNGQPLDVPEPYTLAYAESIPWHGTVLTFWRDEKDRHCIDRDMWAAGCYDVERRP